MISMSLPQYLRNECSYDGQPVHLSPREAELLALLIINGQKIVSTDAIIEVIWPADDEPDFALSIIRRYVHELRNKLPGLQLEVYYGRGYMLATMETTA